MPTPVLFQDSGIDPFAINLELALSTDKEVMVYVHGTKVDFSNAVALTEVGHFSGRAFVGVAFAWPSHQNILSYLAGIDVRRALKSSSALQRTIKLLALHTDAERIHLLAYSAGGKIASKALHELGHTYADLDPQQRKEKLRIGSVVFAAADVDVDLFLEPIPAISELADQVVITVTDDDNALRAARTLFTGRFLSGGIARRGTDRRRVHCSGAPIKY